MLVRTFPPFPRMFYMLSKTEIIISASSILSSANVFNLVQSKILSFAKELKVGLLQRIVEVFGNMFIKI